MTDIEAKALALVNEVRAERGQEIWKEVGDRKGYGTVLETLCRAIEQHEAFKQEVSDVVYKSLTSIVKGCAADAAGNLSRFIIPKPKPDPLVDVAARLGWGSNYVPVVRATLDFFDLEIREKGQ